MMDQSRTANRLPCMLERLLPLVAAGMAILLSGCGKGTAEKKLDLSHAVYGSPPASLSMQKPPASQPYTGPEWTIAPEVKKAVSALNHMIHIDVTHKAIQVNDSVSYIAWAFGGSVPGPVLHVRVGDKVHFVLTNRSDETATLSPPMPHSMDFHAAMVNPEDKYQNVIAGGTISYEWNANYPGVFMYHCASAPVLEHLAYGMVGMVIVEPRDGYPTAVDREYALVQSELYLARQAGGKWDIDMNAARKKQPTYVVFNGRPDQYLKAPLTAKPGERVRFYILNAGPSGTSSFHVIGTIMDRVWLDGNPLNELRGMQTVLLGASSGAIVEFIIPEAGTYTFLDHEFADAEMGARGAIVAK